MNRKAPRQRMYFDGQAPSVVEAMEHPGLFRQWFTGTAGEADTWANWKAVLKAAFALPMSDAELKFFRSVAEREPPARRVKELWIVAGRRAGKDSVASVVMGHAAAFFADIAKLRPGERALCMCLACDREQAGIVLNYSKAFFEHIEPLQRMIVRETKTGFELCNGVEVAVATNSYRATRGRTVLLGILDECAFYRDETSTNPDLELYAALKPGLATLPTSMLIGISSPYRRSGLLYNKFKKHFGRDDDEVLVIRAPSTLLNPTLDASIIAKALEDDPAAARAEWLAEFRADIEGFVTQEVVDAVTVAGRFELPPTSNVGYAGFCDPSGGSADSMTLAIAHRGKDGRAVLDVVRERRPPFSPDDVVAEFATLLRCYGVRRVQGDRYGGEWPAERFKVHGIAYEASEKSKSELYCELLPALNSGRCELLDHARLRAQLLGLERRTSRSGRDSIDHGPGGHDDVSNVCAGAVLMVLGHAPMQIAAETMTTIMSARPYRPEFSERQMGRS
jgi:hypothetical protein